MPCSNDLLYYYCFEIYQASASIVINLLVIADNITAHHDVVFSRIKTCRAMLKYLNMLVITKYNKAQEVLVVYNL